MEEENELASPERPKKKVTTKALKELGSLFRYFLPYRIKFILGFLFLILSAITALIFPQAVGEIINTATGGKPSRYGDVQTLSIGLIIVLAIQSIFSFLRVYWFVEVSEKAVAALRKELFQRLISFPMSFYNQYRVGELTSRLSADIAQIQDTFTLTLAEFLRGSILLVVGTLIILNISWKLTLFMLASFPVLIVIAVVFGGMVRKNSKRGQDALASAGIIVEESLQGIQSVKAFGNELFEAGRYAAALDVVVSVALRGAILRGAFASFIIFAIFGAIVAVIWFGAVLVEAGEITVGELTSFVIYTTFVGGAVGGFGEQYAQIQRALGATERVRELLQLPIEKTELVKTHTLGRLTGNIRVEKLRFCYPGRTEIVVLDDISFEVAAGQTVAIVGPSGSGKSTLMALLLQFYQPSDGKIYFDNKPASDWSLGYLRSQMALVPQDVLLFGGTIKENILYGKPDASDTEVEMAAKQAFAHDFISAFPQGYETVVGERGVKLSGGQRQRVAIARAILRNPAILLLDEATSSLDSESEKAVQLAIDSLMKNRTTLVIAHRLSTIRNADQILVIENGKLVEKGKHQELFAKTDGVYARLATLQFQELAS